MTSSRRLPGAPKDHVTTFGGLVRSELMGRIRARSNASTELRMLALLRDAKLTGWRRHPSLPGRPDFAWPKEHVALFVDGCFWHGHDCGRNLTPHSNAASWRRKIQGNRRRDARVARDLRASGWTVVRVWECRIKRAPATCTARVRRAVTTQREQKNVTLI